LIKAGSGILSNAVVIGNEALYQKEKKLIQKVHSKVFAGKRLIAQWWRWRQVVVVLTCIMWYSGLIPTMSCYKSWKQIALANKETR